MQGITLIFPCISSAPTDFPPLFYSTPGRVDETEDPSHESKRQKLDEPTPPQTKKKQEAKFDYNRIYSDSEEEREYQEKRRRNTEYMEQIEREFKEEQLRKASEVREKKVEKPNLLQYLKIDEPLPPTSLNSPLPSSATIPETPGKSLMLDPFDAEAAIEAAVLKRRTSSDDGGTKAKRPAKPAKGVNGFGKKGSAVAKLVKLESDVDSEGGKTSAKTNKYSSDETSSVASSQASYVAIEHCYSLPPGSETDERLQSELKARQSSAFAHDHGYMSSKPEEGKVTLVNLPVAKPLKAAKKEKENKKELKKEQQRLLKEQQELDRLERERQLKAARFVPKIKYQPRDSRSEMMVLYEFLTKGVDAEDCEYMRRSHDALLRDSMNSYWLSTTHWVDHCTTDRSWWSGPPAAKKRRRDQQVMEDGKRHVTGSARTEGYYKVEAREKMKWKLSQTSRNNKLGNAGLGENSSAADVNKQLVAKMQGISREARSNQRRLLTAFGASTESELLKFNQLKFRKKQLRFAKSGIHDWGLFAMEPIAADEMVIEYCGQMIRPSVADLRETKYEAIGIGSSYLFRIDLETIIDATKCGNLARFINHSCNVSVRRRRTNESGDCD